MLMPTNYNEYIHYSNSCIFIFLRPLLFCFVVPPPSFFLLLKAHEFWGKYHDQRGARRNIDYQRPCCMQRRVHNLNMRSTAQHYTRYPPQFRVHNLNGKMTWKRRWRWLQWLCPWLHERCWSLQLTTWPKKNHKSKTLKFQTAISSTSNRFTTWNLQTSTINSVANYYS